MTTPREVNEVLAPNTTVSVTTTAEPSSTDLDLADTDHEQRVMEHGVTVDSRVELTSDKRTAKVAVDVRYAPGATNGLANDADAARHLDAQPVLGEPVEPAMAALDPASADRRSSSHTDDEPNGAAAATLLAAGFGCALLGVLVVLTEVNDRLHTLLDLYSPVGPLSGKTTLAVIGWLALWAGLHLALRKRNVDLGRSVRLTMGCVAIGFVGTFPPVFQLLAH